MPSQYGGVACPKPVTRATIKGRKDRAAATIQKCAQCGLHYLRSPYRKVIEILLAQVLQSHPN